MKVSFEEITKEKEEEIIVRCYEVTPELIQIVGQLKKGNTSLIGYDGENIYRLRYQEVYYFESVDNKVFIYTKNKVYESKMKLYEIEEACSTKKLLRASKSTIINITKIAYIRPTISGRFEAILDNGETVVVSRQYVPVLKEKLGI
ncbi:MAG: LytTR family DNA-binding domain-containing protein [Clostridiales bacterium]|nr:LytTR family DNA-binding domain-containing protein [Clostridiales bacterium]